MREITRIFRILKILAIIWGANPDLRLCQILGNCFTDHDLYYIEDAVLEAKLKEVYKESLK